MINDKLGLVPATDSACSMEFLSVDDRLGQSALDDAIRARLVHVAVGVGGTGSPVARMLVDLSVYISLGNTYTYSQGSLSHGLMVIPMAPPAGMAGCHGGHAVELTQMIATRWSSACTPARRCEGVHLDEGNSMVGEPLTLRLLFDAFERQASDLADVLCMQFAALDAATTSLRAAMASIRNTLLEPMNLNSMPYVPMLYRAASVSKGWRQRIGDPTSFLQPGCMDNDWSEPTVPRELSDLFAQRCEAVWSETAKALQVPDRSSDEEEGESLDLGASTDAADDFVSGEQMLSLWFGKRRRS